MLYREASVPAIYWEVKCMKKVCVLLLIAMAVLLTSCTIGGLPINRYAYMRVDYTAAANDRFEELIAAVQKQDVAAVQSLFSQNALREAQDMEEAVRALFDYYQGEMISYDDWGGDNLKGGMNTDGTGRRWTALYSTYDVETTRDKYRFAMEFMLQDTADADNVGIRSLYVIRLADDPEPQRAYRGDGEDTPGINIYKAT